MDFCYNIVFYESEKEKVFNTINFQTFDCFGFNSCLIKGDVNNFLSYLYLNKPDIIVINLSGLEKESFCYLIDIIFNNFCKNILVISDNKREDLFVDQILINNENNIELKLASKLMQIKRDIELSPSKNIDFLRVKVNGILNDFQFSARHDGYKYYTDAIILAYMKKPDDYFTMELYKEIAKLYGKTVSAVEKSMRTALMYAFNKLKTAPKTTEFEKRRKFLTYDMNNNTAINMMLNILLNDELIKKDFTYNELKPRK